MSLKIDFAAAAAKPTETDVAGWASDQRVFVSSVMGDLATERQAVADAVRKLGAYPVWFEEFGGREDDAEAAYLREVATSSIYLGILARTYGKLLRSRRSATHEEYREAERLGLRVSVWVHQSEDFQGDQRAFVDEVRLFHTTGRYSTPDDLAAGVVERLYDIAAEELSPWVKLGDAVFRARDVHDDGRIITVRASVHTPAVVAALEGLRPGTWVGKRETRLSYAGLSYGVRVQQVSTRVTNTRATGVEITLQRDPDKDKPSLAISVSFNGTTYSPDDVTELGVRKALFGESPPRGLLSIGGRIEDPLSQLPADQLSTELYGAVLRLLITEALVGSGRASRITKLRISPEGPAGRRIVLSWTGRGDRGESGEERTVEGLLATASAKHDG